MSWVATITPLGEHDDGERFHVLVELRTGDEKHPDDIAEQYGSVIVGDDRDAVNFACSLAREDPEVVWNPAGTD